MMLKGAHISRFPKVRGGHGRPRAIGFTSRGTPVFPVMGGAPTLEELEARQDEIRERLEAIHEEAGDEALGEERSTEWDSLNEEFDRNQGTIDELRERRERVAKLAKRPESTERGADQPPADRSSREDGEIFDLSTIRASVFSAPEEVAEELRGRALKAIERASNLDDEGKQRATGLIEMFREEPEQMVPLARRILHTGSPEYLRAFAKYVVGRPLSADEQRALSVGTDSAGGFAVPFTLDPTVISTSDPETNPVRAISRKVQITTDEWKGVSSAGVTAGYALEAAEAGDNAPTLAQPAIRPQRAHAFVPFSYEVEQDWAQLRQEITIMLNEAKDDLEGEKFVTGTGTNEPQGVVAGLANTAPPEVASNGAGAFAVGDVYKVHEQLPSKYRARAQWLADIAILNDIRQFDTQGGHGLWARIGEDTPERLLGRPAHEASAMSSTIAAGQRVLLFGDFRYYLIVDRIGMSVEYIPNLFGANRRPTGQRGLYAFWRNSAAIISDVAFRVLEIA